MQKYVSLFLLLVILMSCSGDPKQQADRLARKAMDAQLRGDYATAAGYLEKAIEIRPEALEACVELGQVYNYLNRPQDARKIYERALDGYAQRIAAHPDDANALSNQGLVYAILTRFGAARVSLQKALEKDPANRNAAYLLENMKEFAAAWNQVPPPHPDEQKMQRTFLAPEK
jgi:tetratricopeptide (TPR) repeat protein